MSTSNKRHYEISSQDVQESIEIIKKEEGFSEKAYPDPFSPRGIEKWKAKAKRKPDWERLPGTPWTIGYGRTGPDVGEFTTTTKDQELFWLSFRVQEELRWLQKRGVPPCAGLVSLVYNIGKAAFEKSKSYRAFQEGRWEDAMEEMAGFNKAGGKVRPGLVRRRAVEVELVKKWLSRNLDTKTKPQA
jgi:lysozyme